MKEFITSKQLLIKKDSSGYFHVDCIEGAVFAATLLLRKLVTLDEFKILLSL